FSTFGQRIHPDDRTEVIQAIEACRQTAAPFRFQFRIASTDGITRWVQAMGACACDSTGRAVRMTGTVVNITERKQQQEQAESHAAFLQTLIDTIPLPVIYKDCDGVHRLVNRALADSLHLTPAEVLGKTLSQLLGP